VHKSTSEINIKFRIAVFPDFGSQNINDSVVTSINVCQAGPTPAENMLKSFSIFLASPTNIRFPKTATNWQGIRVTLLNEFPLKVWELTIVDNRGRERTERERADAKRPALFCSV